MFEFVSANLTAGQLNAIVKKLGGEKSALRFLRGELEVLKQQVASLDWTKAYEALGMGAQYAEEIGGLAADAQPATWMIPVLKGVTCNQVVAALKKLGVVFYLYADDLDKSVTKNDRDPNCDGSYAVTLAATVEADEGNKDLSADDCAKKGITGITLLERLLLELAYYLATGKHLDIENVTLCIGSRYSDGNVPYVYRNSDDREVFVGWYDSGNRYDNIRARSVVSVPAKQAMPV